MLAKVPLRFVVASLLLGAVAPFAASPAAGAQNPAAVGPKKPVAPLKIAAPAAPPEKINETDFKAMGPGDLFVLRRAAVGEGHYQVAAIVQYWIVQKTQEGRYNLACYLARAGQVDAAFYWLQVAALAEGVDSRMAKRDEDLTALRADERWEDVLDYILECNEYFKTAPISRIVVLVPENYRDKDPIAAVVWLHGFGSNPDDFVNGEAQAYADKLNVALIGISGPKVHGPRSFAWHVDAEQDLKRVREALAKLAQHITIEKGRIVLFGFSQGAQSALEIAVRHPDEFAGAIVFSPGPQGNLEAVKPAAELAKRGFVVTCNADERSGTVQLTADDAEWLKHAGAKLIYKAYPNVADHTFPDDFHERFPEWVKFVLDAGKDAEK